MKENLLHEVWKPIKGYEGLYEISSLGRVRSLDRLVKGKWGKIKLTGKILKGVKDKDGYLVITLSKDGKQKTFKIHRLVAIHFIPNPNNYKEINHKDENKENCKYKNLEWCDKKYNANYGTRNEKLSKIKGKKVNQYDLQGNFIQTYHSVKYAEKITGIKHIYDCCNCKLKTCGGYVWRYVNER